MANPAEKEVRRKSVDDVKVNLLRPSLTSYFAVQIALPTNDGKETDVSRKLRDVLGADQEQLNLLCTDTSLPGSQLTTMDINNDRTGVTEKHAYRRMFDDRIDFTFYVDASNYLPIRFFETWMKGIMMEEEGDNKDKAYNYRPTYPDEYTADQGLKIFKFERDYQQFMTYEFIRSFPLSISSMPVSYSGNDLLKCTVSMSYIRYIQSGPNSNTSSIGSPLNVFSQARESLLNDPNANPFSFKGFGSQLGTGANDVLRSSFNIS
jgi:hypothetical protein